MTNRQVPHIEILTNNKRTTSANYRVKTPSLGTACDSDILQVLSADKCSCSIAEKIEDVLDRILHKA